jgi:ligand-binding SRPBCC domain-containing protein
MNVMNGNDGSGSTYELRREQSIPRPIAEVFQFFADAKNLEAITPPWLAFHILSPEPILMASGTLIEYRLRWHGLPVHWVTQIREWAPPTRFSDVQLRGPYRLWEHTHFFQANDGGTEMYDVVRYALPFGLLGRLAHASIVKADLNGIFDYRAHQVSALLGETASHV